jgi:hypothetical protein
MKNLEEFLALAKQQGEKSMALMNDLAQQYRELVSAHADQASVSFRDGSAYLEKLARAQSLEHAMEIQAEYRKSAREAFVEQSRRMAGLYAGLFKTAFRPVSEMNVLHQKAD